MTAHSPTPETDANMSDGWSGDAFAVDVEFARTLERDRNRLKAECEALRKALELPLLFYQLLSWNAEAKRKWREITGTDEGTTKVMCDTIRKALKR